MVLEWLLIQEACTVEATKRLLQCPAEALADFIKDSHHYIRW